MRFTLTLENADGEQVCMTDSAITGYMVNEVDGLYPPTGQITTAGYAGADGSYLQNAYMEKRNIVINFYLGGASNTIEKRRQDLYDIVIPSQYIKVYYKSPRRNVYTEGYVESVTISNFSETTTGQISILCPDIYWYAVDTETISAEISGEVSSGASASYPTIWLTVDTSNTSTETAYTARYTNATGTDMTLYGMYFRYGSKAANYLFSYATGETFTFLAGGYLEISTAADSKYVRIYDSDGNRTLTIPVTSWGANLAKIPSGDSTYFLEFVFQSGTITDDELTAIAEGFTVEITPVTQYLGV